MALHHDLGVGCRHESREHIRNQADEPIAWRCNSCHARGKISATPVTVGLPTVPKLPECEWCGEDLRHDTSSASPATKWIHKRYCSRQCYYDDLEDRRETGRAITCPDRLQRGRQLDV